MKVLVDDLWASKSTLHLRVTVHDDDGRWRHRYYPAVSLEDVPVEAIAPLLAYFGQVPGEAQLMLFDV